jgi:hypothetical protein
LKASFSVILVLDWMAATRHIFVISSLYCCLDRRHIYCRRFWLKVEVRGLGGYSLPVCIRTRPSVHLHHTKDVILAAISLQGVRDVTVIGVPSRWAGCQQFAGQFNARVQWFSPWSLAGSVLGRKESFLHRRFQHLPAKGKPAGGGK